MNWLEQLKNPNAVMVKGIFKQLLKDRASNYDEIAERISSTIITKKDLESFCSLISELYQTGYLESVKQHKEKLTKMGIKVTLSSEPDSPPPVPKIFE